MDDENLTSKTNSSMSNPLQDQSLPSVPRAKRRQPEGPNESNGEPATRATETPSTSNVDPSEIDHSWSDFEKASEIRTTDSSDPPSKENDSGENIEKKTQNKAKQFLERKEQLVTAMLTQFQVLVDLTCALPSEGATREVAATRSLQMEAATQALVHTAEEILSLTRELKLLWLHGPLRGLGEGEEEGTITDDAEKVFSMVQELLKASREKNGSGTVDSTEG